MPSRKIALYVIVVALLGSPIFCPAARAQQGAIWFGGSGNWSNASLWQCPDKLHPCVPNGDFLVGASSGAIALNIDANISNFDGTGSTTLTLDGTSLTVHFSPSDPGGTFSGDLEVDGGLTLKNGARVDTGHGSTTLLGFNSFRDSALTTDSLSLGGPHSLIVDNSLLNTQLAVINDHMTVGLTDSTWNTSILIVGQNAGSTGLLDIASSTITLTNVNVGVSAPGGIVVNVIPTSDDGLIFTNGSTLKSQGATQISIQSGLLQVDGGSNVSVASVLLASTNSKLRIQGGGSILNLGGVPGGGMSMLAGSVIVSDHGAITGGNLSLATGSVSVESGATWTISDPGNTQDLLIGVALPALPGFPAQTGPAIMAIQSGGSGSNEGDAAIGLNAGADGSLIITGDGSSWKTGGAVAVGLGGKGGLDVANGASLTSEADSHGVSGYIGQMAGSNGFATIEGDNSKWEANGDLKVGLAGVGTLEIKDQAQVLANNMSLGTLAGGDGTVSMTGGTLDLAGSLIVGDAAKGTMTVDPSAPDDVGDVRSLNGIIGAQAGSNGQVTIGSALGNGLQATASQWTIQQSLIVGQAGNGGLDIGGTVTSLSTTIGQAISGSGDITVENGGTWTTTNDLVIADKGLGSVEVLKGGFASVTVGAVTIGNQHSSVGSLDVQGQFNMPQNLIIGASGTGTMKIENGGAVASGDAHIAQGAASSGTVTVTGANSSWSVQGAFGVGEGGTGVLNIQDGGLVTSGSGLIGSAAGSSGSVTVDGQKSLWNATAQNGSGIINVGGGGSKGLLMVSNGGQVIANQVNVNSGGTLAGQGVTGNVTNNGGTVTPTDGPGLMTITGNYTQNSGALVFDIDGDQPGQFDQLSVQGLANFAGGTIDINFENGFAPIAGDTFDLIFAVLGLSNSGVTVDVKGLAPGTDFTESFTANGFSLDLGPNVGPPPPTTPEPSTLFLLATGILALARYSRKDPRRIRA